MIETEKGETKGLKEMKESKRKLRKLRSISRKMEKRRKRSMVKVMVMFKRTARIKQKESSQKDLRMKIMIKIMRRVTSMVGKRRKKMEMRRWKTGKVRRKRRNDRLRAAVEVVVSQRTRKMLVKNQKAKKMTRIKKPRERGAEVEAEACPKRLLRKKTIL